MSASGAACFVALYGSLAYTVTNQVVLELTTPRHVAPNGILLCAAASGHAFDRGSFVLDAVEEGGSQFVSGTARTVNKAAGEAGVLSVPIFSGAAQWHHRPVEVGVAADVLSLDPHYAATFRRRRYDDLGVDEHGASLAGVFQDPTWFTSAADRANASDAVVTRLTSESTILTDSERVKLLQQLAELGRPAGNCALLTGTWHADRRYTLTFSVPNPAAGNALGWWMAPVSYAAPSVSSAAENGASGSTPTSRVTYVVRGDKRGQVCAPRATVSAMLHDACATLQTAGTDPTVAAAGNATACAASLVAANHAAEIGGRGTAAASCPSSSVRSFRYGGHCVSCAHGTAGTASDPIVVGTTRTTCACEANHMTLSAGPAACGRLLGPGGTATTTAALAAELCTNYTAVKAGLWAGTGGDKGGTAHAGAHAVAAGYVAAFMAAAAPMVDAADLAAANATYVAKLAFDERAPDDPSRRLGVKPNCQRCFGPPDGNGRFDDVTGNKPNGGTVRDVGHDAAHALRLLGYLMHEKGQTCEGLYDPSNPTAGVYGNYDPEPLCGAPAPA